MPLGEIAAAAIPSIGSLGAAALSRIWAKKDWDRQNAYNHPKQQVKRLQEAGLPLASMFSGSGGSTSSPISKSEIDPSLGTAKGMEQYNTTRMLRKQLQLMDEQIGKAEADKIISQVGANKALDEDRFFHGPKTDEKGHIIEGNRREDSLKLTLREQEAKTKTAEVMAELSRAKTQADIDHILSTINLGKQQYQYNEIKQLMDKWIVNRLDNKGVTALEAMIYKLFFRPN